MGSNPTLSANTKKNNIMYRLTLILTSVLCLFTSCEPLENTSIFTIEEAREVTTLEILHNCTDTVSYSILGNQIYIVKDSLVIHRGHLNNSNVEDTVLLTKGDYNWLGIVIFILIIISLLFILIAFSSI